MKKAGWKLSEDRYFDPDPAQRRIAHKIYGLIAGCLIISPHGHVDPRLFSEERASFGTPVDLLIIPDHYVLSMLYSMGIPLESMGVQPLDGGKFETDHRKIWKTFAANYYLFLATPTRIWLDYVFYKVFEVDKKLSADTAEYVYDHIQAKLDSPEFQPRQLFTRFNIEVLCTTDAAYDALPYHKAIRMLDWKGDIRPTFRPDSVVNLLEPAWMENIKMLSNVTDIDIVSFTTYLLALEKQRSYFKTLGATATDLSAFSAFTTELGRDELERIFQNALHREVNGQDTALFTGRMLIEFARMSVEDGLVMQLHSGAYRNHNELVYKCFGPDKGGDIPMQANFTQNLHPLLNKFGNDPRLTLVLFSLDESTYTRELAPLAGHYSSIKLGPPWWFYDSLNGMNRYFNLMMETAGLYNTAGFNDDARTFPSIPARHDLWRRATSNFLAGLVVKHVIDESDAYEMALDMAYRQAKRVYRLD
ncbi:MAG: glucuronate isomerase [Anaerolineales bacterium]